MPPDPRTPLQVVFSALSNWHQGIGGSDEDFDRAYAALRELAAAGSPPRAREPESQPEVEFWSAEDVAEFLGIPISTVRYWQWKGIGPRSYKMGRCRRYRPADVRAWAETKASDVA